MDDAQTSTAELIARNVLLKAYAMGLDMFARRALDGKPAPKPDDAANAMVGIMMDQLHEAGLGIVPVEVMGLLKEAAEAGHGVGSGGAYWENYMTDTWLNKYRAMITTSGKGEKT